MIQNFKRDLSKYFTSGEVVSTYWMLQWANTFLWTESPGDKTLKKGRQMERYGELPHKGSFDGQRNRLRSVTVVGGGGGSGLCGPTQSSLFLCLRLDSLVSTVNKWLAAILAGVLMQRFCNAWVALHHKHNMLWYANSSRVPERCVPS